MAIAPHVLYAVHQGATLIDQTSDVNVDLDINEIVMAANGQVDPQFVALMNQTPRITWTTSALARALAKIGINGYAIADADEAVFFLQKLAQGGTREGATSHIKLTLNEGIQIPRTLQGSQGDIATISYEAFATYDGTNSPIVIATGQSLTGSPTVDELFTVGPVVINGALLDGIQDITVDFGITELLQSANGQVWAEFAGIMNRVPSITIRTTNVESIDTFGLVGTAQGITDSLLYFRKKAEGATVVADATAEHIKFVLDEGRITTRTINATQDSPAMSELVYTPTFDGTAAIMAIDTAAAIVLP